DRRHAVVHASLEGSPIQTNQARRLARLGHHHRISRAPFGRVAPASPSLRKTALSLRHSSLMLARYAGGPILLLLRLLWADPGPRGRRAAGRVRGAGPRPCAE